MSTWLSKEWFDETRPLWSGIALPFDLSARLQYEITGGPERVVATYWVLGDGRLLDSGPGVVADPDTTITIAWDDAQSIERGELDPSVAFMQGRLKVAGSMAPVVALLPATRTNDGHDLRRRIAAVTDF